MDSNKKKCLEVEGFTRKPAAAIFSPVFKTATGLDDFHW